MCGILFSLSPNTGSKLEDDPSWQELYKLLINRGPDYFEVNSPENFFPDLKPNVGGFVLHLRGTEVTPQPMSNDEGDWMAFNGEIFGGINISIDQNDTKIIFQKLASCSNSDDIINLLSGVEGPYSILYYKKSHKRLYFGRDPMGRRSMLIHYPTEKLPHFIISSLAIRNPETEDWKEVDPNTLYYLDMDEESLGKPEVLLSNHVHPLKWNESVNSSYFFPGQLVNQTINEELKSIENTPEELFDQLSGGSLDRVRSVQDKLSQSVKSRVENIPDKRVGILFSGGLDCAILARLCHDHLPSNLAIDLLNVGFENPRIQSHKKSDESKKYDVPDRLTGRQTYEELKSLCPERKWNFVEINVPYEQVLEYTDHIKRLIFPSDTVMDLSIALAFWFASRGKGVIYDKYANSYVEYHSTCRVLLSGLGADEQFGGYSRHLRAFESGQFEGLLSEIQLDVDRLPSRNLGRDDRVISDHSKEVRFPFLDREFINLVNTIPIQYKMDLRYPKGTGDKLMLRQVAHQLGLKQACKFAKRAVQFGARTAKMDLGSRSVKGHERLN
ncbi:hypothetical protein CONCODRAFT_15808 [Conidiobolus coronatus NRRL 28638]|uniref:Glutamine amidotransferase type-2 domain-containing protein n=1 Tax=Conidiobolus coronatus (strain ATCC 28846 / CBS 209.66 / NRRL 28638) TaxID=796925 RepID=A0A137PDG0_CONC2|nr:hypothetical protein CONCODRAFT_15808 [Conidiobolus coronatus NRRL 28638]|eukprot:KXN73002.1 hypothetical protein CONCODRAFT_15808 [Conidiobolus coronatus NRRL 28638]